MKSKLLHAATSLLNQTGHHETAAIAVKLTLDSDYKGVYEPSISGSMNISDCSRAITLDLAIHDDSEYENTLFKLITLMQVSTEAYNKLLEYQPTYLKRLIKFKKDKKKEKKKEKKRLKEEKKKDEPQETKKPDPEGETTCNTGQCNGG